MADLFYNSFFKRFQDGGIDLMADPIKLMLVYASYLPNRDFHEVVSHVSGEISGTGYSQGGKALTGKELVQDNQSDSAYFDADDVVWENSTITANAAVLYKDTGDPATSPLIMYIDFGGPKSSNGGDFIVEWQAGGIWTLGG